MNTSTATYDLTKQIGTRGRAATMVLAVVGLTLLLTAWLICRNESRPRDVDTSELFSDATRKARNAKSSRPVNPTPEQLAGHERTNSLVFCADQLAAALRARKTSRMKAAELAPWELGALRELVAISETQRTRQEVRPESIDLPPTAELTLERDHRGYWSLDLQLTKTRGYGWSVIVPDK